MLALDTTAAYACHNVLSQENKYQEQGQGNQGYCRHLYGIVYITSGGSKGISQTVGDHAVGLIVGNQTGPDVGVPRAHHL